MCEIKVAHNVSSYCSLFFSFFSEILEMRELGPNYYQSINKPK